MCINLDKTKTFFTHVFGWKFKDFGSEYTAFLNQGIDGGFFKSDLSSIASSGSALLVFYSEHLNTTLDKIDKYGGKIIKPIFEFPGGRRFHFL